MSECKLPLCTNEDWLTGLCQAHYHRKKRHGDNFDRSPIRTDNMPWDELIEKYTMPIPESGCLIWTAAVSLLGYGMVRLDGKYRTTHRVAYEKAFGSIPKGKFICHKCDVRCCINPAHLYAGTAKENTADMDRRGRGKRGDRWNPKLTEEQVRHIKYSGESPKALMEKYGIAYQTVGNIRRSESWKHI